MSHFNKLEEFDPDTGFVKVQFKAGDLNKQLEKHGREWRLFLVLGKLQQLRFIAGGSGGIGLLVVILRDP